jgi:hypothetical protein
MIDKEDATILLCAEESCPRYGKRASASDCGRKANPGGHRTKRGEMKAE